MAKDDPNCLTQIRSHFRDLPPHAPYTKPAPHLNADDIYAILPPDHRLPYNVEEIIAHISAPHALPEFQPKPPPTMLCPTRLPNTRPMALNANPPASPPKAGPP